MSNFKLSLNHALNFVSEEQFNEYLKEANASNIVLEDRNGKGNEFLGWLDLPGKLGNEEFNRIIEASKQIQLDSEVLLVIGIGGSYLGAKAALEMFKPYFNHQGLEVIFVGHQMSSTYMYQLIEYVRYKKFSINVISKSGTTTEPAIAFRLFKELLEAQVGKEEASRRIYATTDASVGALRTLADTEGYATFVVPDDVGGRYSVLSPVGLLPIAAAGYDIKEILEGAQKAQKDLDKEYNDAVKYAAMRNALYNKDYKVEMLVNYEEKLNFLSEWWKQLFGESEGKQQKGIFVASATFSTDLHSLGQYIQDGERMLFETIITVTRPELDLDIPSSEDDLDKLNYLVGTSIDKVNKTAQIATTLAHVAGGAPNIIIEIDRINEYNFGYLVFFFEKACAISGYTLGVNPFDQPGVEDYKRNMFALLGKGGYEDLRAELEKKIK